MEQGRTDLARKDSQIATLENQLQEERTRQDQLRQEREQALRKTQEVELSLNSIQAQFGILKKEHEKVLREGRMDRSNWNENKRLRAEYRKRSNAEFLKMEQVFEQFEFERDN